MKLRIRGNSIRLRLVKTEVERLADGQQVLETTRLGPGPADKLTYSLGIHLDNAPVQVCWAPGNLGVTVAGELAKELAETQRVTLEQDLTFGDESLKVLIEKDFKCLTPRTEEDETDHFENPQESHGCGII